LISLVRRVAILHGSKPSEPVWTPIAIAVYSGPFAKLPSGRLPLTLSRYFVSMATILAPEQPAGPSIKCLSM
jgi:hypothetical protein